MLGATRLVRLLLGTAPSARASAPGTTSKGFTLSISLERVSNSCLQVICKGSGCSPVGGSFPTSSGQFGSGGSYGSSGNYGTSGSYQTGSIANCRHGQNCNVGNSGSYGSGGYGYGSSSGSSGSFGSSSGSIANCRFGQNCNVGYNTGSSSGSFNNGGFGSSGQQYNPYGSNGQQVSVGLFLDTQVSLAPSHVRCLFRISILSLVKLKKADPNYFSILGLGRIS